MPGGSPMHRVCCAVVRQGVAVASLMLYRPASGAGFTSDERTAVKAAGRYLSLSAAAPPVERGAAMYRSFGEQALLLCEADGRIVRATANGYTLLAQASGCPVNRSSVPHQFERAGRELLLRVLATTLPSRGVAACDDAPALVHLNDWGLFRLHTFFSHDGPRAVLIERADHLLVRLVDAMWHLDLSVQQGEVLLLLALGMSHEMIADRMSVSPNTADYHIRQLYTKLGVHTRNEAVACVLDTAETHATA